VVIADFEEGKPYHAAELPNKWLAAGLPASIKLSRQSFSTCHPKRSEGPVSGRVHRQFSFEFGQVLQSAFQPRMGSMQGR